MKLHYNVRKYMSEVQLIKDEQYPLGISVTGNQKRRRRPIIANIKHGSVAQKSHCLSEGDVILTVRDYDTKGMSKKDVKRFFKDSDPRLHMNVEYSTREACFGYCRINSSRQMYLALRKINGSFGFVVRKSSHLVEYPCISSIKRGSSADREGVLMDGDRLLEVDNRSMSGIPLADVASLLREKTEVLLRIEYKVGIIALPRDKATDLEIACPDANLGMTVDIDDSLKMIISFIQQGSLAQRCGVFHVGDEILSINGTDVKNMSPAKANDLLRRFRKGSGKLTFLHKGENEKLKSSVCGATQEREHSSLTLSSAMPVPHNSYSSSFYDPIQEDDFFKCFENYENYNDYQLEIMSILKDIQMKAGSFQLNLLNETSYEIQDASLPKNETGITNEGYQTDTESESFKRKFRQLMNLTQGLLIRVVKNSASMNHDFANDPQSRTSENPIINDTLTSEFIDGLNELASRRLVPKSSAKKFNEAIVEIDKNCRLCVNEFYAASFAVRKVRLLLSLDKTTEQDYSTIRHVLKRVCQLPLPCHDCAPSFRIRSTTETKTPQAAQKVENNLFPQRSCGVGASSSSANSTKCAQNDILSTSGSSRVGINLSQQTVLYSSRRSESTSAKVVNSEPSCSRGVRNESSSHCESTELSESTRYHQDAINHACNQRGSPRHSNLDHIYANDMSSRPISTLTNRSKVSSSLTSMTESNRQRGLLNEDGLSSIRPTNAFERHSTPLPETPAPCKPPCQGKSSMGFEVQNENPSPKAGPSHLPDDDLVKTGSAHHTDRHEVLLKAEDGSYGLVLGLCSPWTENKSPVPVIVAIKQNSAACKCGLLKKGDRILALNGFSTVGITADELQSLQREEFKSNEVVMCVEFDVMEAEVRWGTFPLQIESCLNLGLVMDEPDHPSFVRGFVKGSAAHRSGQLFSGDEILSFTTRFEDTLNLQTMTMHKTKVRCLTIFRDKNCRHKKETSNRNFDLPFDYRSFVQSGLHFNIRRTSIRTIEGVRGRHKLVLEQDFTLFRDPVTWDFGFLFGENPKTGKAYITDIRPGGPADNSKIIKKYDRIIQVNGVLVDKRAENSVMSVFMKTDHCVNLMTRRVLKYRR